MQNKDVKGDRRKASPNSPGSPTGRGGCNAHHCTDLYLTLGEGEGEREGKEGCRLEYASEEVGGRKPRMISGRRMREGREGEMRGGGAEQGVEGDEWKSQRRQEEGEEIQEEARQRG